MRNDRAAERANLVDEVANEIAALRVGGPLLPVVRQALLDVPRHEFVPRRSRPSAYLNHPLSIGSGQTISQPLIVGLMTNLLEPQPEHRVLEIGTGCGYQTAVLGEVVGEVFSVEVIASLADDAAERLQRLGYQNVSLRTGDGRLGWPEAGPFDGIIVTAAPESVPAALIDQLAPSGRMVVPVGATRGNQHLVVVTKDADGKLDTKSVLPVMFVPLVEG